MLVNFGKNHVLHFDFILTKSTKPLQLLHADLLGRITSTQGYTYYLFILDDYNKFTWIFPLEVKYDALVCFLMSGTSLKIFCKSM